MLRLSKYVRLQIIGWEVLGLNLIILLMTDEDRFEVIRENWLDELWWKFLKAFKEVQMTLKL